MLAFGALSAAVMTLPERVTRPAFWQAFRRRLAVRPSAGWCACLADAQHSSAAEPAAINVLSCFRTIRDWLRSFGVCIGGGLHRYTSATMDTISPPPPHSIFSDEHGYSGARAFAPETDVY